ncbi:MAG: orotate phosphoribosyltransferase [Acidimicrobiales bacterium]
MIDNISARSDDELRALLRQQLLDHAILRGDFVLKSGKRSTWFVDVKASVCRPEGIVLVAELMLRYLGHEVTALGGQTMGADPIAFGVAAIAASRGRALRSFAIRKEPKDHGSGGWVAGVLDISDRVVVVEDASTRGTSMLAAVEAVRAVGAEVVGALSVVDRGGSAGRLLGDLGIPYRALLSAPELGLSYEGGLEP